MAHEFSFLTRVLMCSKCGAPLQTGFAGGSVACEYCGAVNLVTPRAEEPVEPLAAKVDMDEEARLDLLRRQDRIQTETPGDVKQLLSEGELAPWKEGEAFAMWRTTCRELGAGGGYRSAELLYHLTIILAGHFSRMNDNLRQRALFESALEVLTLPRHRQLIRGSLARNAALEGELDAAEKWLEPCNPRSEDLESDSSYRVSRAEIHTMREDWNAVLDVLGRSPTDVPIASTMDAKAMVQRANALEHLGDVDEAAEQLALYMETTGAAGVKALRAVSSVYEKAGVTVCGEAMKAAGVLYSLKKGSVALKSANPGGCFGRVFVDIGALIILVAVVLTFAGKGERGSLIPIALLGIVFLSIGLKHIRDGKRAMRLHSRGTVTAGTVTGIEPTGLKVNGTPLYHVDIEVVHPRRKPYTVRIGKEIPDDEMDRYRVGATLSLKVDPKDHKHTAVLD